VEYDKTVAQRETTKYINQLLRLKDGQAVDELLIKRK
jgi:hypothetical protein